MSFFALAADNIGKVVVSLGARSLGETLKDVKTERRMGRLVQEAVDRIVEQMEGYLRAEKLSDQQKEMIVLALCAKLQPLADDPQRFFVGDLDGPASSTSATQTMSSRRKSEKRGSGSSIPSCFRRWPTF